MGRRIWCWLCVGLTVCVAGQAHAADGELLYGPGGVARLRRLAKQTQAPKYGPASAGIIQGIIARTKLFDSTVLIHKGLKYTFGPTQPAPHKDRFPYWTAMFQERADSITTRINTYTFAYLVTQDKSHLTKAKTIVLALSSWKDWSDPDYPCFKGPACLDTGHAAMSVAYFYDAARSQLSSTEKAKIRKALIDKGLVALEKAAQQALKLEAHNLHAIVAMGLGIGAAAVLNEDTRAGGWLTTASKLADHYLKDQGQDGGPIEYHGYASYALDYLARLLRVLEIKGRPRKSAFLQRVSQFYLASLAPDGSGVATFGDSWRVSGAPTHFYLVTKKDAYAQAYLRRSGLIQVQDYITVGWSDGLLVPRDLPPSPWAAPSVGMGTLRSNATTDASLLVMKSGPVTAFAGHNQLDHLSMQFWAWGSWLLGDAGYSKAGSQTPVLFRYHEDAIGHNTILVDGRGPLLKKGAKLTTVEGGPGYGTVCGEAAPTYAPGSVTSVRRCAVMHPDGFVVLADHVAMRHPQDVTLLFHPPKDGAVRATSRFQDIIAPNARLAIRPVTARTKASRQDIAATEGWPDSIVLTLPAPSGRQPQTMPGADFEGKDWQGWTPRSSTASAHSLDSSVAYQGKQSARIRFVQNGSGYFYGPRIKVTPGDKYVAEVYVRTDQIQGKGARLRILFWQKGKYYPQMVAGPYINRTWPWHHRRLRVTVPAGADQLTVALEHLSATGTVWFDQVALHRVRVAAQKPSVVKHATLLFPVAGDALYNGSFDDGLRQWSPRMRDASHSTQPKLGRGGSTAAQIKFPQTSKTKPTSAGYLYSPYFPVKAGDQLDVEAWVKLAHNKGRGARLRLLYFSQKGYDSSTETPFQTSAGNWKKLALSVTIKLGIQRVRMALEYQGEGSAWFDDAVYTNKQRRAKPSSRALPHSIEGTDLAFRFRRGTQRYLFLDASTKPLNKATIANATASLDKGFALVGLGCSAATVLIAGSTLEISDGTRLTLDTAANARLDLDGTTLRISLQAIKQGKNPQQLALRYVCPTSITDVEVNGQLAWFKADRAGMWQVCWGNFRSGPCAGSSGGTQEASTEAIAEATAEVTTEAAAEARPEDTQDAGATPDAGPERRPERRPEAIAESKHEPHTEAHPDRKVEPSQPDAGASEASRKEGYVFTERSPEQKTSAPDPSANDAAPDTIPTQGCGCTQSANAPHGGSWLGLLCWMLLLWRRRRL